MTKSQPSGKRVIAKEIGNLARMANLFFQHQLKEYEIGHAQLMTLHFICRNNGLSQNELVHHSNLDKSSITSQLNKLVKNGYITREINEDDSRGKRIFITNKTKIIENELHHKFVSWNKILSEGLNEKELELTFSLFDKMNTNAQQAIQQIKDDEKKK
jgi:DNA-binding MarR family transcriptional regulator